MADLQAHRVATRTLRARNRAGRVVKRDSPSKHPTSKLSPFSRLHIVVRKRFPIRTVIQNVVIVVLAVCIVRSGPVLRFYARNTPIWGARGKIEPQTDIAAQVVAGARAQIGSVYDAELRTNFLSRRRRSARPRRV